jgi:hypothetical protein
MNSTDKLALKNRTVPSHDANGYPFVRTSVILLERQHTRLALEARNRALRVGGRADMSLLVRGLVDDAYPPDSPINEVSIDSKHLNRLKSAIDLVHDESGVPISISDAVNSILDVYFTKVETMFPDKKPVTKKKRRHEK